VSNQPENEGAVCTYIEALLENNYNEYGDVISNTFNYRNWHQRSEYAKLARMVSPPQRLALWLMTFTVLGLFLYAAYLHRTITRGHKPSWSSSSWSPQHSPVNNNSNRLKTMDWDHAPGEWYMAERLSGRARRNSGISSVRSNGSSPSAYVPYGAPVPTTTGGTNSADGALA
jgi:hypothetical protein